MKLANVEHRGARKILIENDEGIWLDLTAALDPPAAYLQDLLDAGRFDAGLFRDVASVRLSDGVRFRAPFARPGQIIALARNYTAHARESTLPPPREPIFFAKANTSVVGPGDPIVLPPNLGRVEPEIELAVVIKREASHVKAADAAEYIAGYTILNDVSAQELQAREIREHYPLFRCKSLKTFTPIGPWVVPFEEIGPEPKLQMKLRVNGEARVVTNTSGLTFGVPKLVEFISGYVALQPGDIITTGCPKAAGAIHPGDDVDLEIEKIGVLRNPVVAGTERCPE